MGWGGRERRFGPVGIVGNVLLRFTHRLGSEGREWAREKRESDRYFDQRVHLMEQLSIAVEVAMDQLRSGRDVDEVRAGVIATLSSNFGPEQATSIADFLVAPGVSNMNKANVLAKLSSATGVYDGPSYPAAWWPTDDDSPEASTESLRREQEEEEDLEEWLASMTSEPEEEAETPRRLDEQAVDVEEARLTQELEELTEELEALDAKQALLKKQITEKLGEEFMETLEGSTDERLAQSEDD